MTDVLINAAGIRAESGGVATYATGLISGLAKLGEDFQALVSSNSGIEWESTANTVPVSLGLSRRLLWEKFGRPARLSHGDTCQVLHGLHYTLSRRRPRGAPQVATLHDMTWFTNPRWHSRFKVRWFRDSIRHAARRADALICVSERTERLAHHYVEPKCATFVIPHGVDSQRFCPTAAERDGALWEPFARDKGLDTPYILYVGAVEPRKNSNRLVRAYLNSSVSKDYRLAIAGRRWESYAPSWEGSDRIIELDFVDGQLLPALYTRATAFAYVSEEEGFGLPVLEAMASGTPVLTSAETTMSDIASGAATIVDCKSLTELASGLESVVDSSRQTTELGLSVARGYSWEVSARAHADVYRNVRLRSV